MSAKPPRIITTYQQESPYQWRLANKAELNTIHQIIETAKACQVAQQNWQWAYDYPTIADLENDIANGHSYVLTDATNTIYLTTALVPYYDEYYSQLRQKPVYGLQIARFAANLALQQKGLGKAGLQMVHEYATDNNYSYLIAATGKNNWPMQGLLTKMGFVKYRVCLHETDASVRWYEYYKRLAN